MLAQTNFDITQSAITRKYLVRTPRSAAQYQSSCRFVAGGHSRLAGFWPPHPLTLEGGQGTDVDDIDGNKYIDIINNYSSLIHGHAYPPVVEAVGKQLRRSTAWSADNVSQAALAEQLAERIPAVERLRFTNSGTEAANLALAIAREVMGRRKILMSRYGYHGSVAEFHDGAVGHSGQFTLIAVYNNAVDFERMLAAHGNEIAGVFIEPMLGAGGVLAGEQGFLASVQAAARQQGALFVLDEVQTFRLAPGGMQAQLGLEPDLTLLGKVIGGGFPVGAVGGKMEHMSVFDPSNLRVLHSGTFNANPITMLAGEVALRHFDALAIDRLDQLGSRLKRGLLGAAGRAGLPLTCNRLGSLLNVFFMSEAPPSAFDRTDTRAMELFHLAALNHGVFLSNRGFIALSTAMDEAIVDDVIERCARAMADVMDEL